MTTPIQKVPRDMPAPTSAANVAKRFAMALASQIGYREGRSSSGSWNNDNAYGAYFDQNWVSWCNWFISWGAVAAGIPNTVIPRTGYTPTSWNWYTSRDRDVSKAQAGDLFWVYGYVSSEGRNRVHHIGFVEKVLSEGRIQTIEGNTNTSGSSQGNGVYRNIRTIGPKLRFARPNYAAAVQAATPAKPTVPAKPVTPPTVKPPAQKGDNMTDYQPEDLKKYAGQGVHGQIIGRSNVTIGQALDSTRKDAAAARSMLASVNVQIAGLTAAVKALSEQQGLDPEAIVAAVTDATDKAARAALADLKITLAVDDDETDNAQEG